MKCHKCSRVGHFQKFCKTSGAAHRTKVYTVEQEEDLQLYVESVNLHVGDIDIGKAMKSLSWFMKINMCGSKVTVKIDTGAETSVLPIYVYKQLKVKPKVYQSSVNLTSYGGHKLSHIGRSNIECEHGGHSGKFAFYIVDVKSPPVVGLDICDRLDLVRRSVGPSVATVTNGPRVAFGNFTKEFIQDEFSDNFTGLGCITLVKDPVQVKHAACQVAETCQPKLRDKLTDMVDKKILRKVDFATDWINSLVTVEKKDKSLRVCLNPKDSNQAIVREYVYINTMQDVLPKLQGKKVYSILDMKDAYWPIPLSEESQLLTTFNSPFGKFCFMRMPFGVSPASEALQKRTKESFGDIRGVEIIHDDMIIRADDDADHDEIMWNVIVRARERNAKFSPQKLQFKVKEAKYIGYRVSEYGVKPDTKKVNAITGMPKPESVLDMRQLMGLINYLTPFIPNMSAMTADIRILLKKDTPWQWGGNQDVAFKNIKKVLMSEPVLKIYDAKKIPLIQCDASSTGLGACLMQEGQPVAYISRSLNPAGKNYSQIEKELLAIMLAADKFHHYIYGRKAVVHSDHKPLEIIKKKPLNKAFTDDAT